MDEGTHTQDLQQCTLLGSMKALTVVHVYVYTSHSECASGHPNSSHSKCASGHPNSVSLRTYTYVCGG